MIKRARQAVASKSLETAYPRLINHVRIYTVPPGKGNGDSGKTRSKHLHESLMEFPSKALHQLVAKFRILGLRQLYIRHLPNISRI